MEHMIFSNFTPSLICALVCFISAVTSIKITSETTFVEEGCKFTLVCNVSGPGVHMWYKNGKLIKPDSKNKFQLLEGTITYLPEEKEINMTMQLIVNDAKSIHTGEYKCSNDGIYSQHVIVITDQFIIAAEDEPGMGKLLIPGEPLVLHCITKDCKLCKIEWFKDGNPVYPIENHLKIFENNNSIVIDSASYSDCGVYVCAINKDILNTTKNATIVVQSKIKLDKFEASSVVVEGSPLELYCEAKGSPLFIKWFIGDQEIFEGNERVKLLEHDGLKKGKLLIEEADYPDRNHYTCEAFNQIDSFNTTVFIRVKDKLAALWPFLGICAEVAILCSIIFVYERRKSKSQRDEAETDLPSENKHYRDQKSRGQDVRQRK